MAADLEMKPVDWAAHSGRKCGQCSLCCKLLHVVELNKPANRWCGHCKPGQGGCMIYDHRPDICRGYFCGWMLSPQVSDDWYPLRCHMVLSLAKLGGIMTVTCSVDPKWPMMWMRSPYHAQLRRLALGGLQADDPAKVHIVQVRCDNRVWLVLPNRDVEITRGSYVIRIAAPGKWDVEQFASEAEAAEYVAKVAAPPPIHLTVAASRD